MLGHFERMLRWIGWELSRWVLPVDCQIDSSFPFDCSVWLWFVAWCQRCCIELIQQYGRHPRRLSSQEALFLSGAARTISWALCSRTLGHRIQTRPGFQMDKAGKSSQCRITSKIYRCFWMSCPWSECQPEWRCISNVLKWIVSADALKSLLVTWSH